MTRLLSVYANLLEASVLSPERFPVPLPAPSAAAHRLQVVALLRVLTPDEAAALLRDGQLPDRLPSIADAIGLPVEECGRVLAGAAWKPSEGLQVRTP